LTSKHHLPSDGTRYLLTVSLAASLIFMGLIEMLLKKEANKVRVLKISTGLKFISALLILLLGFYGHWIHSLALLCLVFGTLLIPMVYYVYAWVSQKNAYQES
ncbi:MAG TPA: hypothetical protein VIJ14_08960, partial [Rhabdochlamydiaceae bacterium]